MPRPVCAERTDGGSPRTRLAGDRVLLGDMLMVYSRRRLQWAWGWTNTGQNATRVTVRPIHRMRAWWPSGPTARMCGSVGR